MQSPIHFSSETKPDSALSGSTVSTSFLFIIFLTSYAKGDTIWSKDHSPWLCGCSVSIFVFYTLFFMLLDSNDLQSLVIFLVVFMLCYTAYSVHHPFNKGTAKNLKFYPCWIKAKPTHLHHTLGVISGCIRKCHIINSKIDIEISASEKLWMTAAWLQNHLTTIKMYFLTTS